MAEEVALSFPPNIFLQNLERFSDDNRTWLKKNILNRYRIPLNNVEANNLAWSQGLTRVISPSFSLEDESTCDNLDLDNSNTDKETFSFNRHFEYNHLSDGPATYGGLIDIEGFLVCLNDLEINLHEFVDEYVLRRVQGLLNTFDLIILDLLDNQIYIGLPDGDLFRSGESAVLFRPMSKSADHQAQAHLDDMFLRPASSFDELLDRIRAIVNLIDSCVPMVDQLLSRIDDLQSQLNNIGLSVALSINIIPSSRITPCTLGVEDLGSEIVRQPNTDRAVDRQQAFFFADKALYSRDGRYSFCVLEDTDEYGAYICDLTDLATGTTFLMSRINEG